MSKLGLDNIVVNDPGLQAVPVSPQLQSSNSKVVLVKHSMSFAAGNYLLLIGSAVKTTTGGQLLKQPIKYEFKI